MNVPPVATYTINALNQYTRTDLPTATPLMQSYEYDADGNLTNLWLAGDMNCDGVVDVTDATAFTLAVTSCAQYAQTYPDCNCLNADINGDGVVGFGDINPFVALLGTGNSGLTRAQTWDGENRLIKVEPAGAVIADGAQKAEYVYDYLGRRVEKKVWTYADGSWGTPAVRRFVWSVGVSPANWLLLMEMEGGVGVPPANTVLRKYTWGLDLAGLNGQLNSRDGAGGVGGLLAMQAPGAGPGGGNLDYVYLYDGNGNVGQIVDLNRDPNDPPGAIVASYEYDPYGNVTAKSGPYADANPFRFSTKYWDAETGLGYWGQRYYNPGLGRWLNRDPIDELGGVNLYAYVGNDPVDGFDALGHLNCRRGEPCIFAHDDDYEGGGRCPKKGQSQPTSRPQTQPTSKPQTQPGTQPLKNPCQISDEGPDGPITGGRTVCDGNGGFVICLAAAPGGGGRGPAPVTGGCPAPPGPPNDSSGLEQWRKDVIMACTCQGESGHSERMQKHAPDACKGKKPGENPQADPTQPPSALDNMCFRWWSEYRAYADTASCLEDNGTGDPVIKKAAEKTREREDANFESIRRCLQNGWKPPLGE